MTAVIDVALPVFAILLTGWLAERFKLLGKDAATAFNAFTYWVALPPLLFLSLARKPLGEVLVGPFILAFLAALGVTALMGVLAARLMDRTTPMPVVVQQGLNACFPNTGNMGIPLFLAAFGPLGVAPSILATVLVSSIVIGVAVIGLEAARARGKGVGHAASQVGLSLLKNPLIIAPLLGMLVSYLEIPLPAPLVTYGDLLGATAGPCALFGIGLFLARQPIALNLGAQARTVAPAVAIKLLVQPALAWALATYLIPLPPFWAGSLVILCALPTGALAFVVASRYDTAVEQTGTAILVSTVLSVLTLTVLLGVMLPLPPP